MRPFFSVRGRRAAGRRARSARCGFTLVENLVAVMLISVVVTSVFSLVLTAKMGSKKTGRRAEALYYVSRYREILKSYVTADRSQPGPGVGGGWALPGDSLPYALQPGQHVLTGALPASFTAFPVNGQLSYLVTDVPCSPTLPPPNPQCQSVSFSVAWTKD